MKQPAETRVVIVDDSPTARTALRMALEQDSDLVVVGEASCGREALRLVRRLRPALVTMDVFMRHENGIEVTLQLMSEAPTPILVVTAMSATDPKLTYRAIEAGALEVVAKLPGPFDPAYPARRQRLAQLVRTLARVPVVTRHRRPRTQATRSAPPSFLPDARELPRLVVVGASTGGPPLLKQLLRDLPREFPLPIAIVQHIVAGFTTGMAEWLSHECERDVVVVTSPVLPRPGVAYLAADDQHLEVARGGQLRPCAEPATRLPRPSVDVLFLSAAEHVGSRAVGVLLTGMGRDGTEGLLALRSAGAHTIAQSPGSCTIDSMPRHAIDAGAAELVLDPGDIPVALNSRS